MGIASITHAGNVYRFRTNPNSIQWGYVLNKHVDETYGGRVVQLLSVNIGDLTITAHAGRGGWDHLYNTVLFFRDMLVNQRNSGEPGIFEYPNRGWKFAVYATAMPLSDAVEEVAREFTMQFKVQEDISGIATRNTMDAELAKLREGIGYSKNQYNDPEAGGQTTGVPNEQAATPGTGSAPKPPEAPRGEGGPGGGIGGGGGTF